MAIGAEPVGTLERLAALPNPFVQGNTERYLLTGERPYPSMQDARAKPDLLPRHVKATQACTYRRSSWPSKLARTGDSF